MGKTIVCVIACSAAVAALIGCNPSSVGVGSSDPAKSWQTVGTAGFSTGEADYTSLAIDPWGAPHVAFEDYGNDRKATVMCFK